MKHIGLFGGTFNPIHNGHIAVAEAVFRSVRLNEILFLPSAVPPHKSNIIIPFLDRIKMVEIALAKHPFFFVSDYDYREGKPTYTDELIKRLNAAFPSHKYYFIIGDDNVDKLITWNESEWLLNNVDFLVVTRSNVDKSRWKDLPYLSKLKFIEMDPYDISSSELKDLLRENKPIEKYINPEIFSFIEKYRQMLIT